MADSPKILHSDLKEFLRIQKKTRPAGSHPAAKAMLKKPRTRNSENLRTREYMRIDHGHRA